MDNSNENEVMICGDSVNIAPKKRRSTFFIRRESIAPTVQTDDTAEINTSVVLTEDQKKHEDILKRYYDKLRAEKDQWKVEVNERKNKYHDLKHQTKLLESTRACANYSVLSNEDIEFLKGKPNIPKLVEKHIEFHKSVAFTQQAFTRFVELETEVMKQAEKKVNAITEYLLENSSIED